MTKATLLSKLDELGLFHLDTSWRSHDIFKKNMHLTYALELLAELPSPTEKRSILAIADEQGIPSIRRRADFSPLETTFINLAVKLANSPQDEWIHIMRQVLAAVGHRPDLRGQKTRHPKEMTDVVRGERITAIIASLKRGFEFKEKAKKKRNYASDEGQIESALYRMGYDQIEIKAILGNGSIEGAGCYAFWKRYAPAVPKIRTIRNGFRRYKREADNLNKKSR
jgi:hypothetical protein